jgi:hypothetical protein
MSNASLADVHAAFTKWLYFAPEDVEIIDVALAAAVAVHLEGESLWMLVVDAPGAGKTEVIRSVRGLPSVQFLSTLSPKTLISGFRPAGKDYSLLPKLDGKLLAIKDLTPMLDMPAEQQRQIFGTLRDAYDGFSDHGRGNMDVASYDAKFGLLAGVTNVIDLPRRIAEQELGDRYLKIRFHGNDRDAVTRKALANQGQEVRMRAEIADAVRTFLGGFGDHHVAAVGEHATEELIRAATWAAAMRATVPRDRYHRIISAPSPEVPTRLVKQLTRLASVLATIRGHETVVAQDLDTAWRVAADTALPLRLKVWRALEQAPDGLTVAEISKAGRLSQSAASFTAEDMWVLEVLDREDGSSLEGKDARYKIRGGWKAFRKAG